MVSTGSPGSSQTLPNRSYNASSNSSPKKKLSNDLDLNEKENNNKCIFLKIIFNIGIYEKTVCM